MRYLLLFAFILLTHAIDPKFTPVYQGEELSDAFSSLYYVGNGTMLAGKRTSTFGNRIFISLKNGESGSWKSVGEVQGYTGDHTYWFGSHNNVVLTGTGDTGSTCLMRSTDFGLNWEVVLNSTMLAKLAGRDPGAVFSPIYINQRWIVSLKSALPGKHIIESLDGKTWKVAQANGLTAGARKMIRTSDNKLLYGGTFPDQGSKPGLYISSNGGYDWVKKLDGENIFSGLEDCGNGIYLAGTYGIGKEALETTSRKRENGIATVTTASPHGLTTGMKIAIYTMEDKSFDVRYEIPVTVIDDSSFSYPNPGPTVVLTPDRSGRVNFPVNQKIFRSSDFGETWKQVMTTTAYSMLTYIRSIVHVGKGVVYAYDCTCEDYWTSDRALRYYKSTDFGQTWQVLENQYTGPYGQLNSIYEAVVSNGKLTVATQPDSFILQADL